MSFVSRTPPRGMAMPRADMLTVIRKLGLSSGLLTCLDAGNEASYSSGQSWLDVSGNGINFFRGETSSATTDDPTFNGTAGNRSASENWSYDGGDNFRLDGATPASYEAFHQAGAAFTFAQWTNIPSISINQWNFATSGLALTNTGVYWFQNSSGQQRITVTNGSGTAVRSSTATALVGTAGVWQFRLVSLDSGGGASGSFHQLDGTQVTFNGSYTSPSAGASNGTCRIGRAASGTAEQNLSGTLQSNFMIWNRGLKQEQALAFYFATRSKFGV